MHEAHKLYGQACDAWREYAAINRRAWAQLAQIQLELCSVGLEAAARQWRLLGEARHPLELWSRECDLLAEHAGRVDAALRRVFEVTAARREHVMACIERHARGPEGTPQRKRAA